MGFDISTAEAILAGSVIIAAALLLSAWILAKRERHSASVMPGGMWAPQMPQMEYPNSPEGNPVEPSEVPVRHDTPLRPGSRVLAFSQERWWRAEVIRLEPGGLVRIHFPGWDSKWDTVVPREDLQMDLHG